MLFPIALVAALVTVALAGPSAQLLSLQQSGYNEDDALRLLHYSYASYCPKKMVNEWTCPYCKGDFVVRNRHYNGIWRNNAAITGYSPSNKEIIVAFRGTQAHSLRNWITDLTFFRTNKAFPGVKGAKVHKGFWKAYSSLKSVIMSDIDAMLAHDCVDCTVRITGHSLGGAMATVGAADLVINEGYKKVELLSFGMPRVGNKKFARAVDANLRVGRITKGADIVVSLPMTYLGFRHFPTEVYYRKSGLGGYRICKGAEDKKCLRGRKLHSLTDHLQYLGVNFLGCYLPRQDGEPDEAASIDYERDVRSVEPIGQVLQRLGIDVDDGFDMAALDAEVNMSDKVDGFADWHHIVVDE
ncbi:MAG: hypothetical protein MHM6MM_001179 [Cercozoa sp. M6MM]